MKSFAIRALRHFLILEILSFIFSGFITGSFQSSSTAQMMVVSAILLTFPVTWNYIGCDQQRQKNVRWEWVQYVIEHVSIFLISYIVLMGIILMSTLPTSLI